MKRAEKFYVNMTDSDHIKLHIEHYLKQCVIEGQALYSKLCLIEHMQRYGLKPVADFDPQIKLNRDISDMIPVKDHSILEQCADASGPKIYYFKDVFVSYKAYSFVLLYLS